MTKSKNSLKTETLFSTSLQKQLTTAAYLGLFLSSIIDTNIISPIKLHLSLRSAILAVLVPVSFVHVASGRSMIIDDMNEGYIVYETSSYSASAEITI